VKFFLGKIRFLDELFQVRLAHGGTPLHGPMILRAGDDVRFARLANRRAGLDIFPAENFIRVEADAVADASNLLATVTEREAERIIRHARLRPDWTFDAFAIQRNFNDVAVGHAKFARRLAADQHGVVRSEEHTAELQSRQYLVR